MVATAAARSAGLDDGVGQRTWSAVPSGEYRLGAGEAVLDLRGPVGRAPRWTPRWASAACTVLVPPGVRAVVNADVGVGEIARPSVTGRRTVVNADDQTDVHEQFVVGSGDATVTLDLEVGMGQIEVRRVAA